MEKLQKAGLIGGALVSLSGSLVKRYNECLALLGVKATQLKQFSIDGMGWSPEVAQEKNNNWYLNTGEANVNALILTPLQKDKPVHMPSHSFDRDVMVSVFAAYNREIKDITKDSALIVHLDQNIDTFFEPFDMLRYNTIKVRFTLLNKLLEKQQEQRALIQWFNRKNNFIDKDVHQKLLESAKKYGDLRHRKLELQPITLKVNSFYTRAFGGMFVLKDFIETILVFEDEQWFKKAINDTTHNVLLFHLKHDELVDTMQRHLIIEGNLKDAVRTSRYKRIKKHIFSEHLKEKEHSFQEILGNEMLFKRYLDRLPMETKKKVASAEIYLQRLVVDNTIKLEEFVDVQYRKSLFAPHSSLQEEQTALIWRLLAKIMPKDPVHLYWYDKEAFYKAYETWEPTYQEWVIENILRNNNNHPL
ncbi:hypothetical protein FGM00_15965 [Aggregatimonas sangjinii]|uniref:Uncharacterized protein n=1 Tax=Aggregatimonas sangjinii TaxID=2583587 RepID=A0A5B7SW43_9FLAO|nr:DUF6638 family protein [Aggregatimonas sangjinii]QCX01529.1 hypothetical protein FGM00_15965 [Aggregatimonas sangjinii]